MRISDSQIKEIEARVMEVTQVLKRALKESNIPFNPFQIAKMCDIEVSFINMVKPYALTTIDLISKKRTIYISENVDAYSQKILCYHELGHIFCEKNLEPCLFDHTINQESEYTANFFMAQFMPVFSRAEIKDSTDISYVNHYVANQIRPVANKEQPFGRYQLSILDLFSINDDIWDFKEGY